MPNIYNPNGVVTRDLAVLLDASNPSSYNGPATPANGAVWHDISGGSAINATIHQGGSSTITWAGTGQAKYFNFNKDTNTPVLTYIATASAQTYSTFTIVFRPNLTLNNGTGLTNIISSGMADNTGYAQGGIRVYNVNGTGPWLLNGNPSHPQDWDYDSSIVNNNPAPTWYNNNSINYGNGEGPQLSGGYAFDSGWNILTIVRTNPGTTQFPSLFNIILGSGGIYNGSGTGGANFAGDIAYIAGYTRKLTNAEQIQNFTSLRNRFNPTMI